MAFQVGDEKELALLMSFLECRPFILEGRKLYNYLGDLILPARSALEFIRADLVGMDVGRVEAFDTFVKANPDAFNTFFAAEHAQVDRTTVLENWVWDENGKTPEVPEAHWWWAPISNTSEQGA
ncbi:MAG: hypothetical protein H7Z12_15220 [Rhodospirillaceae bacterium]|nr:hypothetical protein [Rhodospirillales bacterium]